MRRWLWLLFPFALFVAGLPSWYPAFRERRRMEEAENIETELKNTVLPRVSFDDVTFEEAVRVLESDARKAGLRDGIRFSILTNENIGGVFHRRVRKQPLSPDDTSDRSASNPERREKPWQQKMTLQLNDLPVLEALNYVTSLSGYLYRFRKDAVECLPVTNVDEGTFEQFTQKTLCFRPELPAQFQGNSKDIEVFLEKKGVAFYKGTFARFNDAGTELTIVNTSTEINWAAALLGCVEQPTFAERASSRLNSIFLAPIPDSWLPVW